MEYFRQHQNLIREIINTQAARFLLGIRDAAPIVKVTPNSFHQLMDVQKNVPILQARFYADNHIERLLMPAIMKMDIADREYQRITDRQEAFLHYANLERTRGKYPQIYLATATFNPNGTGNGYVRGPGNSAWATEHDAAVGSATVQNTGVFIASHYGTNNNNIYRFFAPFNTSALTAAAEIVAGSNKLELYHTSKANPNSITVGIVQSTQADNTNLVNDDYDQLGTTLGASLLLSAVTLSAYNIYTLNATGDSWISKTSWTKLGVRGSPDYLNAEPTGDNYSEFNAAGGANPPVLTVTYTLPSGLLLSQEI